MNENGGDFVGPTRPRPAHTYTATLAAAAALVLVTAIAGVAIGHQLWPGKPAVRNGVTGSAPPQNVSNKTSVATDPRSALVDINANFNNGTSGAGTGIVLTSNGEVLTNNHVIDGATSLSVTDIGNGRTYDASVVGYDASHDVAVIQLKNASSLQTARLGDSSQAMAGDQIVAIGNAGGTGGTPSSASGSITGLGRSITASDSVTGTSEQLAGLIQIDADIQPGDSGGALVNGQGAVIGMNTAASQGFTFDSQGNEGYAVPIAQALAVVHQVESGSGTALVHVGATAFLGVQVSLAGGSSGYAQSGATISGVVDGTPAQQAGLTGGDTITELDNQPVDSASTLTGLLVGHHPGDKVQLDWTDASGQTHSATVDLATGAPA